jgi:D-alanyl-D-alanine carboxypeptidase (penicillin-binding protein 5/6)
MPKGIVMKRVPILTQRKHFPSAMRFSIGLVMLFLCGIFFLAQQGGTVSATAARGKPLPPTISAPFAQLSEISLLNPTNPKFSHSLMGKAATTQTKIASTTKIMTALLVLEKGASDPGILDRSLTINQDDVEHVIENDASNAGLQVNDHLTVKQLLYALMLPSGCDAAFALASDLGPGEPNFVNQMNAEGKRLGLSDTHYSTADGLDNPDSQGQLGHSNAADLTRLTTVALQFPLFRQIVGTARYLVAPTAVNHAYTWTNTNQLLSGGTHAYPGATGVKTGTTPEAGFCLVFTATRHGKTLLGVVLSSTSDEQRYADATAMLDWGFSLSASAQRSQAA